MLKDLRVGLADSGGFQMVSLLKLANITEEGDQLAAMLFLPLRLLQSVGGPEKDADSFMIARVGSKHTCRRIICFKPCSGCFGGQA